MENYTITMMFTNKLPGNIMSFLPLDVKRVAISPKLIPYELIVDLFKDVIQSEESTIAIPECYNEPDPSVYSRFIILPGDLNAEALSKLQDFIADHVCYHSYHVRSVSRILKHELVTS